MSVHISSLYNIIPNLEKEHEKQIEKSGQPSQIIWMEDVMSNYWPDRATGTSIEKIVKTDAIFYVYNDNYYDPKSLFFAESKNIRMDYSHLTPEQRKGSVRDLFKLGRWIERHSYAPYFSAMSRYMVDKYLTQINNGVQLSWGEIEEEVTEPIEETRTTIIIPDLTNIDMVRLGFILDILDAEGINYTKEEN